jgi:hypothetical protein
MVDALKRASAKRITVVMPFYGYARQDKKHRGREPISARLIADMFKTAGADRLICVDLHTDQIQGFFDGPVDHLMALPILSETTSPRSTATRTSRWCRRMPAGSRSPSSGQSASAVLRWPSSTRRATSTARTRASPTGSSVTCKGPGLRARRRHDRHRAARSPRPPTRSWPTGPPRPSSSRRRTRSSAGRRSSGCATARRSRSSSRTRCRSRPRSRFDGSPCCHRPAHQRGDQGGLRGRLGDQPVRRPRLSLLHQVSAALRAR